MTDEKQVAFVFDDCTLDITNEMDGAGIQACWHRGMLLGDLLPLGNEF